MTEIEWKPYDDCKPAIAGWYATLVSWEPAVEGWAPNADEWSGSEWSSGWPVGYFIDRRCETKDEANELAYRNDPGW